jgi:hypothetical protein
MRGRRGAYAFHHRPGPRCRAAALRIFGWLRGRRFAAGLGAVLVLGLAACSCGKLLSGQGAAPGPGRADAGAGSARAQEQVWASLLAGCQRRIGAERWQRESTGDRLDADRTRVGLGAHDWLVRRDAGAAIEVVQGDTTRAWVAVDCPSN